ncbi:MAG TPA: hypothetical protein VGO58_16080 [Chitinophagaceae bacterium]|jgi:hypothetical protein|nr:hypothetical protein [Chitinophagaceae bacterium]
MKKLFLSIVLLAGFYTIQAQTDSLKQYTGKYKFPDGSPVTEITITIENGLLMAGSAMGTTEFKPTGTPDVFEIVAYNGTATFKKKEGKVTGLQIQVGDINMEGEKTEGLAFKDPMLINRLWTY